MYKLPKLKQEELANLSGQIPTEEIESVIKKNQKTKNKKLTTNKSPGPEGFTGKFYQTLKKRVNT